MENFGKYMVRLITEKPDTYRWGQWAVNLLREMNPNLVGFVIANDTDPIYLNNLDDPKFVKFFNYIMANW